LDAHDVPVVKTIDNVGSISASIMETKTACIEDETEITEGTAGMSVDQNTGKDAFNGWCVMYKISIL
jgi:hypothetical protein